MSIEMRLENDSKILCLIKLIVVVGLSVNELEFLDDQFYFKTFFVVNLISVCHHN